MNTTMSFSARRELFFQVAPRYRGGDRHEKHVILEEFTRSTGYTRKHAIRLLNQPDAKHSVITRQRLRWYGADVEEALVTLWRSANYICAKRLVPYLPAYSGEMRCPYLCGFPSSLIELLEPFLSDPGHSHLNYSA